MTHHHHIPSAPLDQHIAGFTYYKGYRPVHSIDRYLPNGNIEIIIDLTVTPKHIFDNYTLQTIQTCRNIWISGVRESFITIPSGLDAEMFIIEFRKGQAYPFLDRPLTEITGQVVDGDLILPKIFLDLREELLAQPSPADMFSLAEKWLMTSFGNRLSLNPVVHFAISHILASPSTLTIKNIALRTGYSSKHFIRIFTDHVGLTPKRFLRIIRFQKAILDIETKGNLHWAALALDCGYYDQAHFIADFKTFSGFTPLEYMRKKGELINYIPVG
ncbi:MAG TPA: AraC family transcriptional regulator [Puia sp.]|jgi:AraC-like DNA-binding protein|nr:AraC family transcriptional regulator [Puia sp.]